MSPPMNFVRMGTRASALARWQTNYVGQLLCQAWPDLCIETKVISTRGDEIIDTPLPQLGGKGLFTAELEAELRDGSIDLAVHSLKDLPTELPADLVVGAMPPRVNPADILVSRRGSTLEELPANSAVGTSSHRRAGQILHVRPDLKTIDIRGNVDTRIRKALDADGPYDAVLLAHAGVSRLGLLERIDDVTQVLPFDIMMPAPGQGALAIQCRANSDVLTLLAALNDPQTQFSVTAERAFLNALGGGCSVPVAALGTLDGESLNLRGRVTSPDGQTQIDLTSSACLPCSVDDRYTTATKLGSELAHDALEQGATEILEMVA